MSMIRRMMIESRSIRVIMKSRESWFKTKSGSAGVADVHAGEGCGTDAIDYLK